MESGHPTLMLAIAMAAGVLSQSVARHARVPGIVLLLAAGVVVGPEVLGWVEPGALGGGLIGVVDFAVAVILFEGGLNLELSRLRRQQTSIRRLVSWGALITLAGAALATRALLGWPVIQAALFGSLVVVTGPTVVTPLVRELRLRPRLSTVLEAEGVLIDPIGVILASVVLAVALAPGAETLFTEVVGLGLRIGFGAVAGVGAGLLLALILRARRIVPEGFPNIFALASVLVLYEGCEAAVATSGIVAVTVAGILVGNLRSPVDRDLREFKDQLTVLLIGTLFILLAADVGLEDVRRLGSRGAALVAALVLVVRPLNVAVCTIGSALTVRERLFIGWIAPRGIVAAAVASVTAVAMETHGISGGAELRALVFMTIAGTVLLAGLTAAGVARLLGLRLPGRDTVAILGAHGLGLVLGEELREGGGQVVFVDANPGSCRRAEEAGFPVVFGNALEERTLQRARFELVGTAVGLTPNETLNSLFASQARELFGVPRAYVALERADSGVTPDLLRRSDAEVLFERPHDVERWDVRWRHGELEVLRRVFRVPEEKPEGTETGERWIILAIHRGGRSFPMSVGFEPRDGDTASVAVHRPEREAAERSLAALGWEAPD